MRKLCVPFLILSSLLSDVLASAVSQTDWSGGPIEPGPVMIWTDEFAECTLADWHRFPGTVRLDHNAVSHEVGSIDSLLLCKPIDLNGDPYPDLFAGTFYNGAWLLESSDGDSFIVSQHDWDFEDVDTGDIDGDGYPDLVASQWYSLVWLKKSGDDWIEHNIAQNINGANHPRVADIDGDGDLDVFGQRSVNIYGLDEYVIFISWWENKGLAAFWEEHIVCRSQWIWSPTSIDLSDYDGDGDIDAVCGSYSDLYLCINQGSGLSWSFIEIDCCTEGHPVYASFTELNGYGPQEIVTCSSFDTGDVLWLEEVTQGSWTVHQITSEAFSVIRTLSGDLDADGDMDIAVNCSPEGENPYSLVWYENLIGDASVWIHHPIHSDTENPISMHAADMDANGYDDLVVVYTYYSGVPPHVILWWEMLPGIYHTEPASIESSILYVYDVIWGFLDWDAVLPPETTLQFQVRASDDPANMGSWSLPISSPCSLAPYLSTGDSYFQYRASLQTSDSTVTPELHSVCLDWTPTTLERTAMSLQEVDLTIQCNPSLGPVEVCLSIPMNEMVVLKVYDVTGRLIQVPIEEEMSTGYHTVLFVPPASGLYFLRLTVGDCIRSGCFISI